MPYNAFVWHELITSDPQAAEAFYGSVVGWSGTPHGVGDYTLLGPADRKVAGLMAIPDDMRAAGGRPSWFGYVAVRDADAAAASFIAAGGRTLRPTMDIPDVGRIAALADPQGAMINVITPDGPDMPPVPRETIGHVGWNELMASDGPAAFDFYAGQFGWTKADAVDLGPMGIYQLFATGGEAVGGMMTKPEALPRPVWQFYLTVPSIDEAVARVKAGGGGLLMGPHEVPGGAWIANCIDPQGAHFSLTAATR